MPWPCSIVARSSWAACRARRTRPGLSALTSIDPAGEVLAARRTRWGRRRSGPFGASWWRGWRGGPYGRLWRRKPSSVFLARLAAISRRQVAAEHNDPLVIRCAALAADGVRTDQALNACAAALEHFPDHAATREALQRIQTPRDGSQKQKVGSDRAEKSDKSEADAEALFGAALPTSLAMVSNPIRTAPRSISRRLLRQATLPRC